MWIKLPMGRSLNLLNMQSIPRKEMLEKGVMKAETRCKGVTNRGQSGREWRIGQENVISDPCDHCFFGMGRTEISLKRIQDAGDREYTCCAYLALNCRRIQFLQKLLKQCQSQKTHHCEHFSKDLCSLNCKEFWNLTQAISHFPLWVFRFFRYPCLILLICIAKIKQARSQIPGIQEQAKTTRESWQASWEEPDQVKKWAKLMATIMGSDGLGGQRVGLERVMNFLASQETEDNITQSLLCSRTQFPLHSTDGSFSAVYIFLSTSSEKVLKTGKAAQNSKRSCTNSFFLHRLLRQSVTEDYR